MLLSGCATWTPAPDATGASPTAEPIAIDTDTMIDFANLAHSLDDAERAALVAKWEQRYARGNPPDAGLILALVLGQPHRANPRELARARQLLAEYLGRQTAADAPRRNLARFHLALLGGESATAQGSELADLVHLANTAGSMPASERQRLAQRLDATIKDGVATTEDRLRLALLVGNGRPTHVRSQTRARQLLEGYLGDAPEEERALRDFAEYHLQLFAQRQKRLRMAAQERSSRQELEKKLEALKAIELRMSNGDQDARVPLN